MVLVHTQVKEDRAIRVLFLWRKLKGINGIAVYWLWQQEITENTKKKDGEKDRGRRK